MKTCNACKETKPLDEFYHFVRSKDGHQPRCKICANKAHTKYVQSHRAQVSENTRRRYRERKGTVLCACGALILNKKYAIECEKCRRKRRKARGKRHYQKHKHTSIVRTIECNRIRRKEHPERAPAYTSAQWALHSGKIKKRPCLLCGDGDVVMHHVDFDHPLNVIFLCASHSQKLHRGFLSAKEQEILQKKGIECSRKS